MSSRSRETSDFAQKTELSRVRLLIYSKPHERHRELEAGLVEFVRQQSAGLKADVRLIGSTEVLESLFGKLKTLERQESKSGLTGLVLSLGALLGTWTNSRLKEALDQTPVKRVESRLKNLLPESVQSARRLAFAASEP